MGLSAPVESTPPVAVPVEDDVASHYPSLKSCLSDVLDLRMRSAMFMMISIRLIVLKPQSLVERFKIKMAILVYPVDQISYTVQIPRVLPGIEQEIDNFWAAWHVPVPERLAPFARHAMSSIEMIMGYIVK